jgi:co-chaperonin GroES (HSP10)
MKRKKDNYMWTWTNRRDGMTISDFLVKEFSDTKGEVVAVKSPNIREAYVAVKNDFGVHALVVLLEYNGANGKSFGYKVMRECDHPTYYNCPQDILDRLTSVKGSGRFADNAEAWRLGCVAMQNKRKKLFSLKSGNRVKFGKPVQFSNGASEQEFTVFKKNGSTYFSSYPNTYKIKRSYLLDSEWECKS